jgi:hypothetical protein
MPPTAMVVAGDITDYGRGSEWLAYRRIIDEVFPLPVYPGLGKWDLLIRHVGPAGSKL